MGYAVPDREVHVALGCAGSGNGIHWLAANLLIGGDSHSASIVVTELSERYRHKLSDVCQ